jgi:hypothetical protein
VAPCTQQPVEADGFAATRTRMEEMLADLSGPVMMSRTHETLEDYVTATGRELLRQMMQDQLCAGARVEARRASVTGADGVVRHRAEPGHRRLPATTVARIEVSRIATGADNLHPADAALALPRQLCSYPLQKAVVSRLTGSHQERVLAVPADGLGQTRREVLTRRVAQLGPVLAQSRE